jgi:hypothetical protein
LLTLEDRVAIDGLYARYCHTFDVGDGDGFAALFTPDGSFEHAGNVTFTGTDDLAAFVRDRWDAKPGMRHFTANVVVEPEGDGARGYAYVFVFRLGDGPPLRLRNTGEYRDAFVKTGGGWRFAKRTFTSWLPDDVVDTPFQLGAA